MSEGKESVSSNGATASGSGEEKHGNDSKKFELETNEANDESSTPTDERLKKYYFGFGQFHPKWLQIFANKKVFTLLMFVFILIQGSINSGYTVLNISTLEKRYSFNSSLAAFYVVLYDMTIVFGILFISYFGGKMHKPRVMGVSAILLSIGSFITASPRLFFGSYKLDENSNSQLNEECSVGSKNYDVDDNCAAADIGAYIILLIGQICLAIGSTAPYTVAIAYIDEIVHPKFTSLHVGAVLVASVLGPAIGNLMGSSFLGIYVDPGVQTDLVTTDPAWVGAWWIGPVLAGIFALLLSIPFFMFPRWLPDSYSIKVERAKQMAKVYEGDEANTSDLKVAAKQFPIHLKQLLTNPSLILTAFGLAALFIVRDGVISFGPKYVESMFRLSASTAGFLAGGIGIVAAVIGVSSGALITYIWKPVGRKTAIVHTFVVAIGVPFVLSFLLQCPTPEVAGITVSYNDGSFDGRDSSLCSMNCSCQSSVYDPVCGDDGITYFSPCRAGCRTVNADEDGSFVFENCSCIANISLTEFHGTNSSATGGICPQSCPAFVPFLIILFILVTLLLTIEIPIYNYTLRVVADEQRHLALGVQSAIFRIFGSIPGPLLFGAVVDASCVEWDYNCGIRGNCWIYDNNRLGLNALFLCLPFSVLSSILLFLGFLTYPKKRVDETTKEDSAMTPTDEKI